MSTNSKQQEGVVYDSNGNPKTYNSGGNQITIGSKSDTAQAQKNANVNVSSSSEAVITVYKPATPVSGSSFYGEDTATIQGKDVIVVDKPLNPVSGSSFYGKDTATVQAEAKQYKGDSLETLGGLNQYSSAYIQPVNDNGFVDLARQQSVSTIGLTASQSQISASDREYQTVRQVQSDSKNVDSLQSLSTGSNVMTPINPTLQKVDEGYVDSLNKQSVYAPNVSDKELQVAENTRQASFLMEAEKNRPKSGFDYMKDVDSDIEKGIIGFGENLALSVGRLLYAPNYDSKVNPVFDIGQDKLLRTNDLLPDFKNVAVVGGIVAGAEVFPLVTEWGFSVLSGVSIGKAIYKPSSENVADAILLSAPLVGGKVYEGTRVTEINFDVMKGKNADVVIEGKGVLNSKPYYQKMIIKDVRFPDEKVDVIKFDDKTFSIKTSQGMKDVKVIKTDIFGKRKVVDRYSEEVSNMNEYTFDLKGNPKVQQKVGNSVEGEFASRLDYTQIAKADYGLNDRIVKNGRVKEVSGELNYKQINVQEATAKNAVRETIKGTPIVELGKGFSDVNMKVDGRLSNSNLGKASAFLNDEGLSGQEIKLNKRLSNKSDIIDVTSHELGHITDYGEIIKGESRESNFIRGLTKKEGKYLIDKKIVEPENYNSYSDKNVPFEVRADIFKGFINPKTREMIRIEQPKLYSKLRDVFEKQGRISNVKLDIKSSSIESIRTEFVFDKDVEEPVQIFGQYMEDDLLVKEFQTKPEVTQIGNEQSKISGSFRITERKNTPIKDYFKNVFKSKVKEGSYSNKEIYDNNVRIDLANLKNEMPKDLKERNQVKSKDFVSNNNFLKQVGKEESVSSMKVKVDTPKVNAPDKIGVSQIEGLNKSDIGAIKGSVNRQRQSNDNSMKLGNNVLLNGKVKESNLSKVFQSNVSKQKNDLKQDFNIKSNIVSKPKLENNVKQNFRLEQNLKNDMKLDQSLMQELKQEQALKQELKVSNKLNVPREPKMKVFFKNIDIPLFPKTFLPMGDKEKNLFGKSKKNTQSRKKAYTPSLVAVDFGIRGRKSDVGELTGLGINPIVKSKNGFGGKKNGFV